MNAHEILVRISYSTGQGNKPTYSLRVIAYDRYTIDFSLFFKKDVIINTAEQKAGQL